MPDLNGTITIELDTWIAAETWRTAVVQVAEAVLVDYHLRPNMHTLHNRRKALCVLEGLGHNTKFIDDAAKRTAEAARGRAA